MEKSDRNWRSRWVCWGLRGFRGDFQKGYHCLGVVKGNILVLFTEGFDTVIVMV